MNWLSKISLTWPLIIIGTGLLAILGYLYHLLRRAGKTAVSPDQAGQGAATEKSLTAMPRAASSAQLRASFARARKFLRNEAPHSGGIYQVPWFLMLGEAGSGKTTLLAHSGLDLLRDALEEQEETRQGVNWFFFDEAAVLDVDGEHADDPDAVSVNWQMTLRLLQRYRPGRPVDGIIITVPCTDLLGTETRRAEIEAEISRKANYWHKRLSQLQNLLGMSLPVYVLVTKCDQLAGFRSFCQALAPDYREEMLGWSNPYTIETAFAPGQVTEAFRHLHNRLAQIQFELFAAPHEIPDRDGLFRFPAALAALAQPLRVYLHSLFKPSAFHHPFYFRGFYFCGDGEADLVAPFIPADEPGAADQALLVADDAEFAPPPVPQVRIRPVFVKHLLQKKVFAESGLAQPVAGMLRSKSRAIHALQGALVLFVLIAGIGLWRDAATLYTARGQMQGILDNIESSLRHLRTLPAAHAQARSHLFTDNITRQKRIDELAKNSTTILYDLAGVSEDSFSSFFLPGSWFSPVNEDLSASLRSAFSYLILVSLRTELDHKAITLFEIGQNDKAPEFITRLGELIRQREVYNRLKDHQSGTLEDLRELVMYLHNQPLPARFGSRYEIYRHALAEAQGENLAVQWVHERGIERLAERIDQIYRDSLARNRFNDQNLAFTYLTELNATEGLLVRPENEWLASGQFVMNSPFRNLTLITGVRELKGALEALTREKFMEQAETHLPPARPLTRQRILWERAPLEEAIRLYDSYDSFVRTEQQRVAADLRDTVRHKAAARLKENLLTLLRQAMKPEGDGQMVGDGIPEEIRSLREVEKHLTKLAGIFDRLSMADDFDRIVTAQLYSLLQEVNAQFLAANPYEIRQDDLSAWRSGQSLAQAAYGLSSPNELSEFLAYQRHYVATQAREHAAPLINFLFLRGWGTRLTWSSRSVNWQKIVAELDKYDRKAGSTLALLENFILKELDKFGSLQCVPPPPGITNYSSDFFLRTRSDLYRRLARHCESFSEQSALRQYATVQEHFNQHLAGRFPFARISGQQTFAEAEPAAIVELYRLLDEAGAPVKAVLGRRSAAAALEFLNRLEQVRAFVLPRPGEDDLPGNDFTVQFRAEQKRESNAHQIMEWQLEVGDDRFRYREPDHTGRWHFGDPIRFSLRWAKDSPAVPRAEGQAANVKVADRTATFEFTNRWSLLYLLQRQAAPPGEQSAPGSLLGFTLRTHSGNGEEEIKAFIRITVMSPGKKESLIVPRFPTEAPSSVPASIASKQ